MIKSFYNQKFQNDIQVFFRWSNSLMICSLLACFQDRFINKLQVIVRKRQSVELIVDEGFYSEQEMKDDLGWTQTSPQISVHLIYSS